MEQQIDIAIVGGGPAGLSAAITGRVRNKRVVVFNLGECSPKLQKAHAVNNYAGLPEITGAELMQRMVDHATALGVEFVQQKVTNIYPAGEKFMLLTSGEAYTSTTVILATGVAPTALLPGEKELLGRGVSYCATCDGMLYRGKTVAVLAYTEEAEHEAEFLREICEAVHFFPAYKGDFSALTDKGIQVETQKVAAVRGTSQVEAVATAAGDIPVAGVFILRASDPVETLLPAIEMEGEAIRVDRGMRTNIPGVFAAGDCTGKPWQISRATGEGLVAVLSAIEYIAKR